MQFEKSMQMKLQNKRQAYIKKMYNVRNIQKQFHIEDGKVKKSSRKKRIPRTASQGKLASSQKYDDIGAMVSR